MAKVKLMIDPGHEGDLRGLDPGAVSKYGKEADFTLQISRYQYNRFKQLGVSVGLTRDEAEALSENTRVALAQQGEYCLSNHLNAGGGDRAEVIHSIHDDGKLANKIKDALLAVGQNAVKVYFRKNSSGGDYYYMHRRTGATKTNIVEYCFIDNDADFTHFKNHMYDYAEAVVRAFCSHIGHPYTAPGKQEAPKQPGKPVETVAASGSYKVQKGDTLYGIAKANAVTVAQLKQWNNLKSDTIHTGDVLKLSGAAAATTKPATQQATKSDKYPLPSGVLKYGAKGNDVKQLQTALNAAYFKVGAVDGSYGPATKDAVTRFQKVYTPYDVDGIYGPKTREALNKKVN